MNIILNGAPRDIGDGTTVKTLLDSLQLKPESVAVELNLDIVPKKKYDATALKAGDKLEIIAFVGGG